MRWRLLNKLEKPYRCLTLPLVAKPEERHTKPKEVIQTSQGFDAGGSVSIGESVCFRHRHHGDDDEITAFGRAKTGVLPRVANFDIRVRVRVERRAVVQGFMAGYEAERVRVSLLWQLGD